MYVLKMSKNTKKCMGNQITQNTPKIMYSMRIILIFAHTNVWETLTHASWFTWPFMSFKDKKFCIIIRFLLTKTFVVNRGRNVGHAYQIIMVKILNLDGRIIGGVIVKRCLMYKAYLFCTKRRTNQDTWLVLENFQSLYL